MSEEQDQYRVAASILDDKPLMMGLLGVLIQRLGGSVTYKEADLDMLQGAGLVFRAPDGETLVISIEKDIH